MPFLVLIGLIVSCQSNRSKVKSSEPAPWEEDGLYHLRTTERISGNPYADFVFDEAGNIYIASFQKSIGPQDRILILKVSPLGEILWEKGHENSGRATGITMSPEGKLWVCGFFKGNLSWEGHSIESEENSMFWARIDQEGKAEFLEKPEGEILGYSLHSNQAGDMLMFGTLGASANFGGMRIERAEKESQVLILMDQAGRTKWIKPLEGNVKRMISDTQNSFWLGGDFLGEFSFGPDSFSTDNRFDRDGFLIRIGEDSSWSKQIGHKGILKWGYSPYEGINDLAIGPDGQLLALISVDNPNTQDRTADRFLSDVGLYRVSDAGDIRLEQVISSGLLKGQVFRMASTTDGQLWISGNGMEKFTLLGDTLFSPGKQAFLINIDPNRRRSRKILPSHGPNTSFRNMKAFKQDVFMSGHYSSYLKIGKDSIENEGIHALFYYRKFLPTL